jgi:serine/threonine protein kinase
MHWFNQSHLWMFTLSPRRRARLLLFHFIQKSNSDVQQLHQIFEPFSDLPRFRRREQTIAEIYNCGQQCVVRPNDMSAELWALLRRCLAPDPALRPTMIEVVAVLESLSSYSHGMITEVRNAVE